MQGTVLVGWVILYILFVIWKGTVLVPVLYSRKIDAKERSDTKPIYQLGPCLVAYDKNDICTQGNR